MTRLLEQAIEAARDVPSEVQDYLAQTIFGILDGQDAEPYQLSEEERQAIARSRAEAARGEFVPHAEIKALFAKYR